VVVAEAVADVAAADGRNGSMGIRSIEPRWPRHPRVRACVTMRDGGVGKGAYASLNLATHVGDQPGDVLENRLRLRRHLELAHEPAWLTQVHGVEVFRIERSGLDAPPIADAAWTDQSGVACAILTADCVPVLVAADDGTCVAAAHAGWRGLAAGVLENTVRSLPAAPDCLSAWLGPGIGPGAFEVGRDVFDAFVDPDPDAASAFMPARAGHYLCDLHALARRRLAAVGVTRIDGVADACTFRDAGSYFSHRRDRTCGRMATLIWLA
jgi:YfiH family protein